MNDPDLDGLTRCLVDLDDHTVCGALADLLAEREHPRAEPVRQLADARPVVPERPRAPGRESSASFAMACSPWWVIELSLFREPPAKTDFWWVEFRTYEKATTTARLKQAGIGQGPAVVFLGHEWHSREDVLRAFDAARRIAIGFLLGEQLRQARGGRVGLCFAGSDGR